jgi:hypothetical protein
MDTYELVWSLRQCYKVDTITQEKTEALESLNNLPSIMQLKEETESKVFRL